jgi:hypothetical protein
VLMTALFRQLPAAAHALSHCWSALGVPSLPNMLSWNASAAQHMQLACCSLMLFSHLLSCLVVLCKSSTFARCWFWVDRQQLGTSGSDTSSRFELQI